MAKLRTLEEANARISIWQKIECVEIDIKHAATSLLRAAFAKLLDLDDDDVCPAMSDVTAALAVLEFDASDHPDVKNLEREHRERWPLTFDDVNAVSIP